jgi:membrane protein DedA with SNARE-associated domain
MSAQIECPAREARREVSSEGAETQAVYASTVDEQRGLSFATKVMGDELDPIGAREPHGRHAGTLPPTGAQSALREDRRPGSSTTRDVQHLLTESGYAALILLAFAEACCVPIPSEVTFGFAGVLAASGRLNLALVLIVGVAAELAGSSTAFGVGRIGGRPLVERLGRYVLLTSRDLDRAERWLSGRGEFAVTVGRAMPVVRAFTSIVAGTAEMPIWRFESFNFIGTVIYTSAFAAVGYEIGNEWKRIAHDFSIAGYVLAALVVVAVAAFIVVRVREFRREQRLAGVTPRTSKDEGDAAVR